MAVSSDFLNWIELQRLIAIVRLPEGHHLAAVAEALDAGGIRLIEFALTTPGALEGLRQARALLSEGTCLGVGTVLDASAVRPAVEAGAQFVVTPVMKPEVILACQKLGVPCVAGAYSPTEIQAAWEAGAAFVKVFPATALGPGYIKDILAPLPHLRLVPTGGVTLENAALFLRAGAAAVAVGSQLVSNHVIREGRLETLTERARQFLAQTGTAAA